MAETELYKQIAATGIIGMMLVLALLAVVHLYRALVAEKNARIEDASKFNATAMTLQKEVMAATASLGKIADAFDKKEERLEREFAMRAHTPQAFTPVRRPSITNETDDDG